MPPIKLKWSSLLSIPELDFVDTFPGVVNVSDELQLSLAWLTAATQSERKLLRCDDNGVLLVSDAWNGLNTAEVDELGVAGGSADTFVASEANRGCLLSTGGELAKAFFYRISGVLADTVYVPSDGFYWYPHSVHTVTVETVPAATGPTSTIGLTTFN